MMRGRTGVVIAAVVWLTASGCSSGGRSGEVRSDEGRLVIGVYPFTESRILGEMYRGALASRGIPSDLVRVASRELMEPAVEQGVVDIVPEYQGTFLGFLDPSFVAGGETEDAAAEYLKVVAASRGLVPLGAAPAENKNEIVVTTSTASALDLISVSDLAAVAPGLTLGGPPECPSRPLCLEGLQDVYGLDFARFHPLDVGGPLTAHALLGGEIDVGILFTTDPILASSELRVLHDDLHLQPAENIVPVVRSELIKAMPEASEVLDEVSSRITEVELRTLIEMVDSAGHSPRLAVKGWLATEGFSS